MIEKSDTVHIADGRMLLHRKVRNISEKLII